MPWEDEALHVGQNLVLKVFTTLVAFLKVIKEKRKLLSIPANQVEDKLLF